MMSLYQYNFSRENAQNYRDWHFFTLKVDFFFIFLNYYCEEHQLFMYRSEWL